MAKILILVGLIVAVMAASSFLKLAAVKHAASVGIIGGADGPTAVYVAGKFSTGAMMFGGLLAAILVALFFVWLRNRTKKK